MYFKCFPEEDEDVEKEYAYTRVCMCVYMCI